MYLEYIQMFAFVCKAIWDWDQELNTDYLLPRKTHRGTNKGSNLTSIHCNDLHGVSAVLFSVQGLYSLQFTRILSYGKVFLCVSLKRISAQGNTCDCLIKDVITSHSLHQLLVLPDWVRVGVVTPDGGDDATRLLALSDGHLVVTLREDRTFVHVIDVDRDCCRGCRSVSASDQSHWVMSAENKDVFALTLKVQDLGKQTCTHKISHTHSQGYREKLLLMTCWEFKF